MPVTSATVAGESKSEARAEGLATWESEKGPGFLTVCLYRVNGQETEALGAADINASSSPWELTLAAAPGHGRRFFQMLVELSGDNGLTPTRKGGEVTPKASAVFRKLYRSNDFKRDHVDGPHFEPWLNATYYGYEQTPDLLRRLRNHKNWSRNRSSLISWFLPGKRPDVNWIPDKARQLLNGASFLYSHGQEGYRAIAIYAAKLLWLEYRKEESPRITALYPTESYPGFVATETPHKQTFLFRSHNEAKVFATHMGQNLIGTTPDHVIPVIHVDLHRLVQNQPGLYEIIAKRLGMVTWSFVATYWDIVADELGVNHVTAFANESCIILHERCAQ